MKLIPAFSRMFFIASIGVFILLITAESDVIAQAPIDSLADKAPPRTDAEIAELTGGKLAKTLDIRVTDNKGNLIAGAKVNPWALRDSQGHGSWAPGEYDRTEMVRETATTNENGIATIKYPYYNAVSERVRTIGVSILVSHPDFVMTDSIDIDIPLENGDLFDVKLESGASLELLPTIDGKPIGADNLYVNWSDPRSVRRFNRDLKLETTDQGTLRLPPMRAGANSVQVVQIENDRATYLSALTDVELVLGEIKKIEIPLIKAMPITGKLSDDVPRLVHNGLVELESLQPADAHPMRVQWHTWIPVQEDGSFTINAWPPGEAIRALAICDGFHSDASAAPSDEPHAQVFKQGEPIEVRMVPMANWAATVLDEYDYPVAGVEVRAWPWTDYAGSFARSEMYLQGRDDQDSYPHRFQQKSDQHGKLMMQLPAGMSTFSVTNDMYELPVMMGRRKVRVDSKWGQKQDVTLRLQYKATEQLGDWDKLAGVVFGCGTRDGLRIRALPGVKAKMDAFVERFREAKNQRDPQQLSEAYTMVAEAFAGIGDQEEAKNWRRKSAEQKEKVTQPK